jgi:hypothetical protein
VAVAPNDGSAGDRPIGTRLEQKIDVFTVRDGGTDPVLPQPTRRKLMTEDDQFRAELDQLGDEEVQKLFDRRAFSPKKSLIVQSWLKQKDRERQAAAQEPQEAQEDAALVLARQANEDAAAAHEHADKANKDAAKANRTAWVAIGVAVAALIASVLGWSK